MYGARPVGTKTFVILAHHSEEVGQAGLAFSDLHSSITFLLNKKPLIK